MSATTDELAHYARFLRNAAPQAYDDFVAAFAKYSSKQTEILVLYVTDNLLGAQGHAQQCVKILQVLEKVKKDG